MTCGEGVAGFYKVHDFELEPRRPDEDGNNERVNLGFFICLLASAE